MDNDPNIIKTLLARVDLLEYRLADLEKDFDRSLDLCTQLTEQVLILAKKVTPN